MLANLRAIYSEFYGSTLSTLLTCVFLPGPSAAAAAVSSFAKGKLSYQESKISALRTTIIWKKSGLHGLSIICRCPAGSTGNEYPSSIAAAL